MTLVDFRVMLPKPRSIHTINGSQDRATKPSSYNLSITVSEFQVVQLSLNQTVTFVKFQVVLPRLKSVHNISGIPNRILLG